jgi:hypothetical protein
MASGVRPGRAPSAAITWSYRLVSRASSASALAGEGPVRVKGSMADLKAPAVMTSRPTPALSSAPRKKVISSAMPRASSVTCGEAMISSATLATKSARVSPWLRVATTRLPAALTRTRASRRACSSPKPPVRWPTRTQTVCTAGSRAAWRRA